MIYMRYLTGASTLEKAQLRGKYLALACNCHLSVGWDSGEFVRDNLKRQVDDYNRKVLY